MSNSELLRIKNKQKTTYKKQKTASSYKINTENDLMTDLGLNKTRVCQKGKIKNQKLPFLTHLFSLRLMHKHH